ncbi:hypothetical protein FR932_10000 [Moritella marina ATCC 15381]|uniref:Uncharacterized protein n=1 Tax=Moritella marina ATCC 15381 TaxID=1202962 RepID=A0A5J6WP02_MORMI|nr:hypothetical protein [Moritella marina]QFI38152.1 hypothetical protein FR932_10000 [Moritella marina ATCC 15381]
MKLSKFEQFLEVDDLEFGFSFVLDNLKNYVICALLVAAGTVLIDRHLPIENVDGVIDIIPSVILFILGAFLALLNFVRLILVLHSKTSNASTIVWGVLYNGVFIAVYQLFEFIVKLKV